MAEPVSARSGRAGGGIDSLLRILPNAWKAAWFGEPDVLVIVVDLDQEDLPATADDRESAPPWEPILQAIDTARKSLRSQQDEQLVTLVAVAVPVLEAWLQCPSWNEPRWRTESDHLDRNGRLQHKKKLKRELWGRDTEFLSQVPGTVESLINEGRADQLAAMFPIGFEPMLAGLQTALSEHPDEDS